MLGNLSHVQDISGKIKWQRPHKQCKAVWQNSKQTENKQKSQQIEKADFDLRSPSD